MPLGANQPPARCIVDKIATFSSKRCHLEPRCGGASCQGCCEGSLQRANSAVPASLSSRVQLSHCDFTADAALQVNLLSASFYLGVFCCFATEDSASERARINPPVVCRCDYGA